LRRADAKSQVHAAFSRPTQLLTGWDTLWYGEFRSDLPGIGGNSDGDWRSSAGSDASQPLIQWMELLANALSARENRTRRCRNDLWTFYPEVTPR